MACVPPVLLMRLIRPWLLIRFGFLMSERIGHFAANTELYLCERDAGLNVPRQCYVDLFSMQKKICNRQLAMMWNRILRVWPFWIIASLFRVNQMIPGGAVHEIGSNTHKDRDVFNLLDRFPAHLVFSSEEEIKGQSALRRMGIPKGALFICLNVRDNAYLAGHIPEYDWGYHDYRDSKIGSYVLVSEELADRGYYVIRMGAKVKEPIGSKHPKVIDYATNGMRTDFLDIYLGAKCFFSISTSTGWDSVPYIFRRPVVYVNMLPLGGGFTFAKSSLFITKQHFLKHENRALSMREIFECGAGFLYMASDFDSKGITLMDNSPEEIRDVVLEMLERLNSVWQPHEMDEALQNKFWEIFPVNARTSDDKPWHGEIKTRFGAAFLRSHQAWLN
jgi:putative glycosyltransferase (TIGR04372 family)